MKKKFILAVVVTVSLIGCSEMTTDQRRNDLKSDTSRSKMLEKDYEREIINDHFFHYRYELSDGENPEDVVDDSKWEEITEEKYKSLINN